MLDVGRVPFDQKFRFEFLKFSHVEWNGIFHHAGPISFYSHLSTFSTKNYSVDKMLKDRDEVAVLSAVTCYVWRSLTRTQNSTLPWYYERNLRTSLAGEYANRANWPTGNSERTIHKFPGHQILTFQFRSRRGLNYGRSFCIQCSVDSKDSRHLVAFHD